MIKQKAENSSDILIRRANVNEAEQISIVVKAAMLIYKLDSNIPNKIEALTESSDDFKNYIERDNVFIAELQGEIIGVVRLVLHGQKSEITRFSVLPTNQNSGTGSRLLDTAEAFARKSGAQQAFLHTSLNNHKLVSFYESRGYVQKACESSKGYPRCLFEKELGTDLNI